MELKERTNKIASPEVFNTLSKTTPSLIEFHYGKESVKKHSMGFWTQKRIKYTSKGAVFATGFPRKFRNHLEGHVFEKYNAKWLQEFCSLTNLYNITKHGLTKLTPVQSPPEKNEEDDNKNFSEKRIEPEVLNRSLS